VCAAQFGAGGITPINLERVLTVLEVWAFYVCIHSFYYPFTVLELFLRWDIWGTFPLKGMPFNDGRIGKIVGLGINLYFSKEF